MRDAFGVERDDVSKAWNSILKPKAGIVPESFVPMTRKDIAAAGRRGNQMNALSNKKAAKVTAQQTQTGTQVAPGVREYKPGEAAPAKAKKDKKPKSFLDRNRKGLMWGAGGVGVGGLGGYALSRDTA
jgi:hypothetical protein